MGRNATWHTGRAGLGLLALLALMLVPAVPLHPAEEAAGPILRREVNQPFEDVVLTVRAAINGQNYRVTGENDIGGGLRKRGYTNFPDYLVIHFCNLEMAREGLEVDMRLGAIMPCRIVVYEEEEHVVVLLPDARSVLAPLDNPGLAEFERKLAAVYTAILNEIDY